jgi:O-antigen biosynthesis protein
MARIMKVTEESRHAILVLGMHRSGTSAITRVLSLLGASLPHNVSGASPGNERGHWEPKRLVALNDKLLAEAESRWDDWRSFELAVMPMERQLQYERDIAHVIAEEFADTILPVIKDPRICRFVNLYEHALESLGIQPLFLIPHRNPLAVIESLAARDKMTRRFAALLWLRHALDAERASRSKPRAFISYETLLDDWRTVIGATCNQLRIDLPTPGKRQAKEIEGYLSKDLQHYTFSLESLDASKEFPVWIGRAYRAFLALSNNPKDEDAQEQLDEVWYEFESSPSSIQNIAMQEMFARVKHYDAEIEAARNKIAISPPELQTQHDSIQKNPNELQELRDEFASLLSEIDKRNLGLDMLHEKLQSERDTLAALQAKNVAQIETLQSNLSAKEAQNYSLTEALATLQAEHSAQIETLRSEKQYALSCHATALAEYNRERFTVLAPIYRNCYRMGGKALRRFVPEKLLRRIRGLFPHPDSSIPLPIMYETVAYDAAQLHVAPACALPDVFVFSIIDWNFRYQRPQHIAKSLSAARRVFYVEMTLAEADHPHVRKLSESLYIVRLPSKGIGAIPSYTGRPSSDQIRAWLSTLYAFCDSVQATAFKHVILQHPFWWQLACHLPPEFHLVFDCMDDIAGFSNTEQWLIDLEKDMIRNSDHLIVSSQYLFDKYESLNRPVMIRNGGELDHFLSYSPTHAMPSFLSEKGFSRHSGKIYVGYVGAIAEWFDSSLISGAALANPNLEFHLCGAVTSPAAARLADLPNVTMHGEIRYLEVPAFIAQMDVLTIPFQLLPLIHACDPVKFYEYSASGKPTVATRLPELQRAKDLVFFASSPEDFAEQICAAHQRGAEPAFQESLREYAANNTWDQRAGQFEKVLYDFPKVTVILLAYGEPHWTLAAMHSLHDNGAHYPNMEVLVVDNGSPEHWLADIHNAARQYPEVTVIENGENLGFARGNNVGLEASTGDYVMLLNNDTYVAPGAIHAMVRHLQRNPNIGAVGPLTNNIGNEAKLFVDYEDMQQMKITVRQATTGYRGTFTPLSVLAYFSVMFRRADLEKFGLLSEEYGRGMFEDDDHCAAIRSHGYLCALAEDAFVHHHLSATFSTLESNERTGLFERNKSIFEARWGEWTPHVYRYSRPFSSII